MWALNGLLTYLEDNATAESSLIKEFFFFAFRYAKNDRVRAKAAWGYYQFTLDEKYLKFILKLHYADRLYRRDIIHAFKDFVFNEETKSNVKKSLSKVDYELFYPP